MTTQTAAQKQVQIASTILQQLGGNRFLVMTGAHQLLATESGLRMKLRKNKTVCNLLEITLNEKDLYDMKFFKGAMSTRVGYIESNIITHNDIYADQLQEIFTSVTGMYTKL